jgi:hypothetical protein
MKDHFWIGIYYKERIDSIILHQNISLPHLYANAIENPNQDLVEIDYKSIRENLLQFPYQTNCYNYREESFDFISKEECIVKHFQQKEFEECGCNKKMALL